MPCCATPDAGGQAGCHERRQLTDRPSAMPRTDHAETDQASTDAVGAFTLVAVELTLTVSGCVPEYDLHGGGAWAMRPFEAGSHPQRPCICRESWRGRGFASGLFAATVRPKQFPRRCAPSSRNKFFVPTGPSLRCGRFAMQRAWTRTHRITPRPQWLRPG
jgi:hypothetical protein